MESVKKKRDNELDYLKSIEIEEEDENPGVFGVLLSDEIEGFGEKLICPFNEDLLKPAGYKLTVGDEYFLEGEHHYFDDGSHQNHIAIPPFQVAVIKTGERVFLPRFLIARWNLLVKHAYKGLLWVGAAQVDPGYRGFLFCPLYNLSNKTVRLNRGEDIALIDFVKTTPFKKEISQEYHGNDRPIIEDFGVDELKSALFQRAGRKIEEFDGQVSDMRKTITFFITVTFVVLAAIISALTLFVSTNEEVRNLGLPIWSSIVLFFVALGFLLSIFNFVAARLSNTISLKMSELRGRHSEYARRFFNRIWWSEIGISLSLAFLAVTVAYFVAAPVVENWPDKLIVTQEDMKRTAEDVQKEIDETESRVSESIKRVSEKQKALDNKTSELESSIEKLRNSVSKIQNK